MNLILAVVTLVSVALANAQQQEHQSHKQNPVISFPTIGRSDKYFLTDKQRTVAGNPGIISQSKISNGAHVPSILPYSMLDPMAFMPSSSYPFEGGPLALMSPSGDIGETIATEFEKRNNPNTGGMWFGPRLGRRKRSVDNDASSSAERHENNVDIKPILKMLHGTNWAIIMPVRERERRTFTPRLGRRSSSSSERYQRAQPFSPRLGRSGGRVSSDYYNEEGSDYSESFGARSGRGDPFSPRLGRSESSMRSARADPFSPRLGRSAPSSTSDEKV